MDIDVQPRPETVPASNGSLSTATVPALTQLETPALLVDLDVMEANIQRWQAAADAAGVAFRPHAKTHKAPAVAAQQLAAGAVGLVVAKVAEAEIFAAAGCRDIVIAYPVVGPSKWCRLAELACSCMVTINVESEIAARGLSAAAVAAGSELRVHVDIDTGLHRCGVPAGDPESIAALCRHIRNLPGLELDGITTFRHVIFPGADGRPLEELGREEGELMVGLAERLRAAGIALRTVAVGSTPTALAAATVPGVTEVRAGTYVFGDALSVTWGAITDREIALSVLCTVVSRPTPERATVDGGSKTFAGDVPASMVPGLQGYGRVVGAEGYLDGMTEEHGIVRLGPGRTPHIGDRLRVIPNHVCTTVNLADEVVGIRNGQIETVWPVVARGKRT
jgi:D-serine deaminase-like pyridoxal phosphate-dependent protein